MNRLKSIAFTATIAIAAIVLTIICLPMIFLGEKNARKIVGLWARFSLWAMRVMTGVSFRVEGEDNIPKDGGLVVSNHQSLWETIALFALLPNAVVILKKELLRIPVYGWWVRASGNITVDRKGGAKALRAMRREAAERIANGAQVVVFPEGTRIKPGETHAFQPGVAGIYKDAGADCIPVAHDSGRFWRKLGGALEPGIITLRFMPPVPPGLDRKTFLARIEKDIADNRQDLIDLNASPQHD